MIKKHFKQRKLLKFIKQKFKTVIRELKLINSLKEYPVNLKVKFIECGYILNFNISGICDYSKIENNFNFIRDCFAAIHVEAENNKGIVTLRIYKEELEELNYRKYILNNTELLLGYNYNNVITVDMILSPHLLVAGLSGNGKSRMVNYILCNLIDADITILNGFEEDYKNFNLIYSHNQIENYLSGLLENKTRRQRPLYIILEELQGLSSNKKISALCKELLSFGRHYNIFVIGIIQIATKENCKFKDLFNSRLTFKQNDNSAYSVCLGITVDKDLKQREFYVYANNGLEKGMTFNNIY